MMIKMNIEKQSTKFIKPIVPTPSTLRHYKLGFLDEIAPDADCSICLFFAEDGNHKPKFLAMLETSLEKTLTQFYPLAGRYVKETQTIDCNDQGAEFIYARVDLKMEDILGFKEMENVMFIDEFIPSKVVVAKQLNEALLAIQVTTFACGGVALGIRATHKIVDASTLCTFINEWAVMNRAENENEAELIPRPGFNSASFFPARGLRAPALQLTSRDMLLDYARIKLSFSESTISNMKAKLAMANGKCSQHRFSKVQIVLALIWKALIGANRATPDCPKESILFQAVNLREKMLPFIPKNSCGNLLAFCAAKSKTNLDTHEELSYILSDSVQQTITNLSNARYDNEEGKMMVLNSFPHMTNIDATNVYVLSSWCKFRFYADFGFGKPIWAVPGTIPAKNTGYLMDDAEGNGVEAYLFLEVKDVPYFKEALVA